MHPLNLVWFVQISFIIRRTATLLFVCKLVKPGSKAKQREQKPQLVPDQLVKEQGALPLVIRKPLLLHLEASQP